MNMKVSLIDSKNYNIIKDIYTITNVDPEDSYLPYYSFSSDIYKDEQLLKEMKLINFIESVIDEKSQKINKGNANNYIENLNGSIEKFMNYKYVSKEDYFKVLDYLKDILENKRLSILDGSNEAYNIEEFNFNNTLSLNNVLNGSDHKEFILRYASNYEDYLYNFIPVLIDNYRYENNLGFSQILNDLEKRINDINIGSIITKMEKNIKKMEALSKSNPNLYQYNKHPILKYELSINQYISYVETYNKILTILFERKRKYYSKGIIYNQKLNIYLEILYNYYQSLIYSDILLRSDTLFSKCPDSQYSITYYNCTTFTGY
eukprot:jgi/Orpsp1_1/1174200/evm.model.c7180000049225.1